LDSTYLPFGFKHCLPCTIFNASKKECIFAFGLEKRALSKNDQTGY